MTAGVVTAWAGMLLGLIGIGVTFSIIARFLGGTRGGLR